VISKKGTKVYIALGCLVKIPTNAFFKLFDFQTYLYLYLFSDMKSVIVMGSTALRNELDVKMAFKHE